MKSVKLKVELLAYSENPELIISAAARLCYSPAGITQLLESIDDTTQQRMIKKLFDLGHESPVEHVNFTFGIEGVSRSLLAQLTRHRIASYSVKSQRYVKEGNFSYIMPPEIKNIPAAEKIFNRSMEETQNSYNQLVEILIDKHYADLISKGYLTEQAKQIAEKKAIEDARFVLPNSCETKLIMTMNVRSLFNFFAHRCCNRAQWEIRDLAKEMLKLVKGVAPTLFKKVGPECLMGPCPEGKMSCGKIEQVRKEFTTLE